MVKAREEDAPGLFCIMYRPNDEVVHPHTSDALPIEYIPQTSIPARMKPRRARTRTTDRPPLPLFSGEAMSSAEFHEHLALTRSEADIQREIIEQLRRRGWIVVRINGGGWRNPAGQYVAAYHVAGLGSKGMPDIVAHRGTGGITCESLFVEVKRRGGKVRASQLEFIKRAAMMGVTVHIADDWKQVAALVDRLPAQAFRAE